MPNIKVIQAAIAELPKGPPLVIAISGGTTGIGSYIAKAFATTFASHGAKLRVYIIGRNAERAETVLSEGRRIAPGSDWRFVKATDLTLLGEVDRCCEDIIKQENELPFAGGPARLDLLYMTHSTSPLLGKIVLNAEGLDGFTSSIYYSRIRLINQLTPLLQASTQQAHVISVYAGTMEEVKPNEPIPLSWPSNETYNINTVRKHVGFMKTFTFEELADKHAGKISFTHIYPGLVDGPGFYSSEHPLWFKILWRVMYPFLWLTYITPNDTCGQVMAYLATGAFPAKGGSVPAGVEAAVGTEGQKGSGAYSVGQRADPGHKEGVKAFAAFDHQDLRAKVWKHTMEVFERVEKGK